MDAMISSAQKHMSFWGGAFIVGVVLDLLLAIVLFNMSHPTDLLPAEAIWAVGIGAPLLVILSGVKYVKYHGIHRLATNSLSATESIYPDAYAPVTHAPTRAVYDGEIVEDEIRIVQPRALTAHPHRLDVSA